MDPNDVEPSSAFPEEEKMDSDDNWFSKNLGDESDSTAMKSDLSDKSGEKKDELAELKSIEMSGKKHDISNELKEMFEEKSSDAEELQESTLTKHSLVSEITKEDKLKDIVPDDILGKDDSFDGLDNEVLHQELEHLTYEKSKELISELPNEVSGPDTEQSAPATENQLELQQSEEIDQSLDELTFEGKTELLKDIAENIGSKEIDEIMESGMSNEEDNTLKDGTSELKEISSSLEESCVDEIKGDLENQFQSITGENVEEEMPSEQESIATEEIVNQVDKSSIELTKENMMVEFAHDNGNQVLIQINTDQSEVTTEEPQKSDAVVMETSDGQTLVFSTETLETTTAESDMVAQVEGGAEFLQAVTGKFEDVLAPTAEETVKKETDPPVIEQPVEEPVVKAPPPQPAASPAPAVKKDPPKEGPKCCVTTCKSGKSTLRTTFRYFKPPVNQILYKKWEYIFNQARQQISPNSLICELHFRTGLIYKRGLDKQGRVVWALREGALPKLSPSGIHRVTGGVVPPPSTTVQVTKKPQQLAPKTTLVKSPVQLADAKATTSTVKGVSPPTPKYTPKKILQKPLKTVAQKISNEVTDIGFLYKNPELVKVAQEEIASLDVLVCGECHSVFHLVELFQAHKMAANCKGESNFKGNPSEPKPQVWAFLLWKSAQAKVSDVESSWKLYQRWCRMNESVRNSWISAGKFLQEGNMIASLKLVDTPMPKSKVGRPSLKDRITDDDEDDDDDFSVPTKAKRAKITKPEQTEQRDLGGAGDASNFLEQESMEVESSAIETERTEDDDPVGNLSRHTPELITSEVEIKQEVLSDDEHGENKENDSVKRRNKESGMQSCFKCKRPISNPKAQIRCTAVCHNYFHAECTRLQSESQVTKLGLRKNYWTCDFCQPDLDNAKPVQQKTKGSASEDDAEEFVVEKIVSRRYNIKKKHFEYLLKWEGYPSEQNTWEPAENLGTCQHLLKAFEEALAKQQAAKQAAAKQGGVKPIDTSYKVKPPIIPGRKPVPAPSTPATSSGRPVRSSKQKAMDQVKAWCGSIVRPSDDDNIGNKRKASSDSEYDGEEEMSVKKVKIEVDSDDDVRRVERVTPNKGRPTKPSVTFAASRGPNQSVNKAVVNGDDIEANLASVLGLDSDDEMPPVKKSTLPIKGMSSLSPSKQQVLVASAKGVMTVDSKQVPNLSSGVYIMSNKTGIVKVDNDKTLSTLQKSGLIKKPASACPLIKSESPKRPSGVVILPKTDTGSPQPKSGVLRKTGTETPVAGTQRPPGVLKPMKPGVTPRPLGVLKPSVQDFTPSPPTLSNPSKSGVLAGSVNRVQQLVRPNTTTPLRGRPIPSPLVKKAADGSTLQATTQQKVLIAKNKAEVQVSPSKTVLSPTTLSEANKSPLMDSPTVFPPVKSANKVLAHQVLGRGGARGRGIVRGRGRGGSLGHMLQMQMVEPDPVKDSKLVESDNLLMEFQEPSDSEESDDGLEDIFPSMEELPPIEPDSPPRPMTLCPLTGKRLCKAEGERTPEPTPPPSPKAPTPSPPPPPLKEEEPTHILPDHQDEVETETVPIEEPEPVVQSVVTNVVKSPRPTPAKKTTTTTIVKQDGMICKVEMSPGGTTGTLVEAVAAPPVQQPITEGTVTIKKPRGRQNRGPQLSVMPTNSGSTSLGTITVPARKLFQDNDDDMVTITGEDGMVYQVSNSELAGNTLMLSTGEDGQQQCVYVTTDAEGGEEGTILTLDSAYADAVAQLGTDQVNILSTESGEEYYIEKADDGDVEGEQLMTLEGEEDTLIAGDDQSGQVVAQLVEAGEPAPGGSRRVVLLLPDGNLMMTEVDEEQYAALDLDK